MCVYVRYVMNMFVKHKERFMQNEMIWSCLCGMMFVKRYCEKAFIKPQYRLKYILINLMLQENTSQFECFIKLTQSWFLITLFQTWNSCFVNKFYKSSTFKCSNSKHALKHKFLNQA